MSPSTGTAAFLTPTLTGAQPALYTSNGQTVRPLGGESNKSLALLNALDEGQRKQGVLNYLVLGPGKDGKTIQPEGLRASNMTAKQRDMLLDLISEWAGIVHENARRSAWLSSRPTSVKPGSPGAGRPPPSRAATSRLTNIARLAFRMAPVAAIHLNRPIAICDSHKHEIYLRVVISDLEVIPTLYSETRVLESNQVESCADHSAKPTVFMLASIR